MQGYEFIIHDELPHREDILAATYVLTLRGSQRKYMKQLRMFSPSLRTYVVVNDGYKKTQRALCKQAPVYDATFSYTVIFRHAQKHHPGQPILILEDDFFWANTDLPRAFHEIREFLLVSPHVDHYFLGALLLPSLRFVTRVGNHVRISGRALGAHAVISTPKGMNLANSAVADCKVEYPDPYFSEQHVSYRYQKQLCYQLFEDTPSQRTMPILGILCRILRLDKRAEPLWSCMYMLENWHAYFIIAAPFITLIIRSLCRT